MTSQVKVHHENETAVMFAPFFLKMVPPPLLPCSSLCGKIHSLFFCGVPKNQCNGSIPFKVLSIRYFTLPMTTRSAACIPSTQTRPMNLPSKATRMSVLLPWMCTSRVTRYTGLTGTRDAYPVEISRPRPVLVPPIVTGGRLTAVSPISM